MQSHEDLFNVRNTLNFLEKRDTKQVGLASSGNVMIYIYTYTDIHMHVCTNTNRNLVIHIHI